MIEHPLRDRSVDRRARHRSDAAAIVPVDGLGFQLVPWQPILDKRIGQYLTVVRDDDGGIEWTLGRKRGLGL
jgi:Protein of unknown function (DUF3363)